MSEPNVGAQHGRKAPAPVHDLRARRSVTGALGSWMGGCATRCYAGCENPTTRRRAPIDARLSFVKAGQNVGSWRPSFA